MDREEPMKPRVLVVEDDPVSRAFFLEVLSGLPAEVDAAAGCRGALACARVYAHALWLVDAHLPDGSAVDLLPRLRAAGGTADVVAIAHTASRDAGVHAALLDAGFADVLAKPVGASCLLATVGQRLRQRVREPRAAFLPARVSSAASVGPAPTGPWDDAAAMAALGDAGHVRALRALFATELPRVVAQLDVASQAGDAAGLRDLLHRLASACAFTGAHRLGEAVHRWQGDPADPVAMAAFRDAAARLLASRSEL